MDYESTRAELHANLEELRQNSLEKRQVADRAVDDMEVMVAASHQTIVRARQMIERIEHLLKYHNFSPPLAPVPQPRTPKRAAVGAKRKAPGQQP